MIHRILGIIINRYIAAMEKDPKVIELIKKYQLDKDIESKNKLLACYYEKGCTWAKNRMKKLVYTDLINPSNSEIASLVYQSFEKSINTIKIDDVKSLSFQNYFYLMIGYQIYSEMKTTLNYCVVTDYQKEVQRITREMNNVGQEEANNLRQVIVNHSLSEIVEFLENRNTEYARIIVLKSRGYRTKDICKELNISAMSLKSKTQYIKKLIRENFDCPFLNF